jgi:hypothetical protein
MDTTITQIPEGVLLTIRKQVGTSIHTASYVFNSPCEAQAFAASSLA